MEPVELRPLSLGELLDRTFRLYRNHFLLFVSIMAIPAAFSIPANVLLLTFQGSVMNAAATAPGKPPVMPVITIGAASRWPSRVVDGSISSKSISGRA